MVTFSHKAPPSEDFMLTNSGAFILKRRLNYNVVQKYNFIVTAKVSDAQSLLIIIQFRAIKHINNVVFKRT